MKENHKSSPDQQLHIRELLPFSTNEMFGDVLKHFQCFAKENDFTIPNTYSNLIKIGAREKEGLARSNMDKVWQILGDCNDHLGAVANVRVSPADVRFQDLQGWQYAKNYVDEEMKVCTTLESPKVRCKLIQDLKIEKVVMEVIRSGLEGKNFLVSEEMESIEKLVGSKTPLRDIVSGEVDHLAFLPLKKRALKSKWSDSSGEDLERILSEVIKETISDYKTLYEELSTESSDSMRLFCFLLLILMAQEKFDELKVPVQELTGWKESYQLVTSQFFERAMRTRLEEALPATYYHLDNMVEAPKDGDLTGYFSKALKDAAIDWIKYNSRVYGNNEAFDQMKAYQRSLENCSDELIPGTDKKVSDLDGWKESMDLVNREIIYIEDQHITIQQISLMTLKLLKEKEAREGLDDDEIGIGNMIKKYHMHDFPS